MLPADLPAFLNGFTRQSEFWLYDQTSAYYRRHLLLHEGTQASCTRCSATSGRLGMPREWPSYWARTAGRRPVDAQLFSNQPQEVPKLGRIEIVETEFAARRAMRFTDVLNSVRMPI